MSREFKTICKDCKKPRTVRGYRIPIYCIDCSRKHPRQRNTYWHFCNKCHDVKSSKQNRASCFCAKCSKGHHRKSGIKWSFDFESMSFEASVYREKVQHFRICPSCEDVKEVAVQNSGVTNCKACDTKRRREIAEIKKELLAIELQNNPAAAQGRPKLTEEQIKQKEQEKREKKALKQKKYKEKKVKENTVGGIDGQKHNKVTVKFVKYDLESGDEIKRQYNKKEEKYPMSTEEQNRAMIDAWMSKNEVTRVA